MSKNHTYSAATLVAAFNSGDIKRPLTHTRTLQVIAALEGAPDWFALRHRMDVGMLKARAKFLRAELNSIQGNLAEDQATAIIGRVLAVKADAAAGGILSFLKRIGHRRPQVRWATQSGQVVRMHPLAAEISFVAGQAGSGKSFSVSRILRACTDANVPLTVVEKGYPSYDWCPCMRVSIPDVPPLTPFQAVKTIFNPIIAAARRNAVPSVIVFDECFPFLQPDLLGPTCKFLTEAVELDIHPILVTQTIFDLEPLKPLIEAHEEWRTNIYQFKSDDFDQSAKLVRNAQYAEFIFITDGKPPEILVMRPSFEEYATFTTTPTDIEQINAIQSELQCNRTKAREEFARRLEQSRRHPSAS